MPAPIDNVFTLQTTTVSISLEPALNAIHSLMLLTNAEHAAGVSDWAIYTALEMTPEERRMNDLVIIGFYYAVAPRQSWTSFPAYLNYLEAANPLALRDQMLSIYLSQTCLTDDQPVKSNETELAEALASLDGYLEFLRRRFDEKNVKVEVETQAFRYINDPPAMKELIISHLRLMWEKYLAPEWNHNQPLLEQAARALDGVDLTRLSRTEAARLITGQDLPDDNWSKTFEAARKVIFVPNAHVGPYLGRFYAGDTMWVLYRPRLPRGAELGDSELSRAEIIVRLDALADDSRLRILRFVAENEDARAQDIIQALDLSQSAASRHLMQLSATGYLNERRCEGGKCYSLNRDHIRETLRGITSFILLDKAYRPFYRSIKQ